MVKITWSWRKTCTSCLCLLLGPLFFSLVFEKSQSTRQSALDPVVIDDFIARQLAAQRIPGLALAITRGDQVMYVQGYGTAGNGLAVMQLVEAGKINLDAPVKAYLPEFTLADPTAAAQITIRQLLNQASGLSERGFPDMQLPQPETIEERVTSLREARLVARPGTEYHYFSPNYGILARVVEVVSGQPFSEYLQTHVFAPLEMKDTLSVVTSTEGKRTAAHLAQGHLVAFGAAFAYPEADGYLGGSGGVISTAEDMAHYLIAQNNAGRYQGQALVTPESMTLMHTPPSGIASTYAMGWTESSLDGMRVLEHNGVISTYSADAILLPDQGIGIALLYNVSSLPTISFAAPQIRNGLIALLTGRPVQTSKMTVWLWGWLTAGLTLIGGFLAMRSLLKLPQWSQKAHSTSPWRLLPGIAWSFAPLLALLGIPALTARFADRVFGFVYLYKSMLEIFAWLVVTGTLRMVNGTARIAILLQRFRKPDKRGHPVLERREPFSE